MYINHAPIECFECGVALTGLDWGLCIVCSHSFCHRHLVARRGVTNCAACEELRRLREQSTGVSEADEARVVGLVLHDLATTLGAGHEPLVREAAARIRLFSDDAGDFEQRVVDDVQQHLHDSFADTSWPRCPDHPNHPLWYSEKWWRCEQSGKQVAPLGGLSDDPNKPPA